MSTLMSTPVFVDPEISTQADEAQSSRVPDDEIDESLDSDSVSRDAEDESPTAEDEDLAAGDEGLPAGDEGPSMGVESHGLDDKSHGLDDEGHNGSGFALEPERPERVSASRQPTLTTWTDLEDGIVYIDVYAFPPPAPPAQTPPSPEWSSGSLPISPAPSVVPSPISSPMIPLTVPSPVATPATAEIEGFFTELGAQVEMQGGLICDHVIRLEELSPALFERYDRDIRELFTRLGAVWDEIFSQRYLFRSFEHEHERVAVTFGAL
ncbi:hypothetical protein Tco_0099998 [Tanacetum coccineum]